MSNKLSCNHISFRKAKERLQDRYCCLELIRATEHVALLPKFIGNPTDVKTGIKALLDAKLNSYSIKYGGIPIAYDNVSILDSIGIVHAGSPTINFNVMLDYIIFNPNIGSFVSGTVNKVSTGFLGVLIHDIFNASILMPQNSLVDGQEVVLEITHVSTYRSLPVIHGKLVDISSNAPVVNGLNKTLLTADSNWSSSLPDSSAIKPEHLLSSSSLITNNSETKLSGQRKKETNSGSISDIPEIKLYNSSNPGGKKGKVTVSLSENKVEECGAEDSRIENKRKRFSSNTHLNRKEQMLLSATDTMQMVDPLKDKSMDNDIQDVSKGSASKKKKVPTATLR